MRDAKRRMIGLVLGLVLVPVVCLADGGTAGENRSLLEQWRQDPDHAARLKSNQSAFRRLSPDGQERLRKLDRDLAEETPAMRVRLKGVLDRYNVWLESLPEDQRRSIESAPDRKTRLERIRDIRQQDLVKRLAKAQQEQIAKLQGKEKADLTAKLLQEDLEQRADWRAAERNWDQMLFRPQSLPLRLQGPQGGLPKETYAYIEKNLLPVLTSEEDKRLKEAEGKWPRFPRVLIELADNHPTAILPVGPTHIHELNLSAKGIPKSLIEDLRKAEGKWPDFGVVIRKWHKKPGEKRHVELEQRFTPQSPRDFPLAVQQFIDKRLLPALTDEERRELTREEGNWPEYPRRLTELARKHNLPIPGDPIPGPIDWDRYRVRPLNGELR